ncbi:hypothetical protein JQ625_20440 [Bradyrhizobium diazoefficiens]|nr:hypothetical protein [Bradyrhizobium diazoefficiens]MBR0777216.1 hypothetical protein [Bradyrhizobium diazoefficiens]
MKVKNVFQLCFRELAGHSRVCEGNAINEERGFGQTGFVGVLSRDEREGNP